MDKEDAPPPLESLLQPNPASAKVVQLGAKTAKKEVKEAVVADSSNPLSWLVDIPDFPDDLTVKEKICKESYHPIQSCPVERGQPIPFAFLSSTLDKISETRSRLEIIDYISEFIRSLIAIQPSDIIPAIYLLSGKLGPTWMGIELGVGESTIIKAVCDVTGRTAKSIKEQLAVDGDLGVIAAQSKSNQGMIFKTKDLHILEVYQDLLKIAQIQGSGSNEEKMRRITGLLSRCKNNEAMYIVRILGGKLRIGAAAKSVLLGLARAFYITRPSKLGKPLVLDYRVGRSDWEEEYTGFSEVVKSVHSEYPDYGKIVATLLRYPYTQLREHCHLTAGVPVEPMLAQPTKGMDEVSKRLEGCTYTSEFKYDGERAQIHYDGNKVMIFSRNQENYTSKYPDVATNLSLAFDHSAIHSFILDAEAVAYDREEDKILSFQTLATRSRKDVQVKDIKVQVCIYAFDLLYLNGEPLLRETLKVRREKLFASFTEQKGVFTFADYRVSDDINELTEFLEDAVKGNCEGLMVKTLEKDATYEPTRRSYNWLKVKKDYITGMTDTVDLVPIGGYYGKGKRTGNYGGYLLACYDETAEEFVEVCKVGTGFKDEELVEWANYFKDKVIPEPKSYCQVRKQGKDTPDVWFDPSIVWEIQAADLTTSPRYIAAYGQVAEGKGISLRFPRFLHAREDKPPEKATTLEQLVQMYHNQ